MSAKLPELPDRVELRAGPDTARRLIAAVTEFLNRGYSVRDAVAASFKRLADLEGASAEVRVTEEVFERTVAYFARALDEYRAQEAAGRSAVGSGLFVESVDEDEFAELTKEKPS